MMLENDVNVVDLNHSASLQSDVNSSACIRYIGWLPLNTTELSLQSLETHNQTHDYLFDYAKEHCPNFVIEDTDTIPIQRERRCSVVAQLHLHLDCPVGLWLERLSKKERVIIIEKKEGGVLSKNKTK